MSVSYLAFRAISLDLSEQSNCIMDAPTASIDTSNEALSLMSINDDVEQPNLSGNSGLYLNSSHSMPAHHNLSSTSSSPYSRMVFIDNLPIDKCKMSLSAWTLSRPKTPVYGLLTFANETGYEKAIDASLRIFGMIIQRHPVRSIPSWRMNTLYIEDIPAGHPCIDFEYQLSNVLEPNNIFVCLKTGQNYTLTVGSCEIKFPTFEIAYESYKIYSGVQEKLNIFERNGV